MQIARAGGAHLAKIADLRDNFDCRATIPSRGCREREHRLWNGFLDRDGDLTRLYLVRINCLQSKRRRLVPCDAPRIEREVKPVRGDESLMAVALKNPINFLRAP